MKTPTLKSSCCNEPVKLNTPDSFDLPEGQTMYYICKKCDMPCNFASDNHVTHKPQLSADIEKRFDERFICKEHPREPKHFADLEPEGVKHFLVQLLTSERERILDEWQENHPQESLEKAVESSRIHGGINSYGSGYDRGYLDCNNQIIQALKKGK